MSQFDQSFKSHQQWVDMASYWLTAHPDHNSSFRAICFDSLGNICQNGGDFKIAYYPVYWVWPDQNLFEFIGNIRKKLPEQKQNNP